ncbi:recombinase family protein [Metabacillus sp. Hm71]|uniref:recombinase family protein n=1 Tax=Metabacillus sp. Hm71 TaxID=3450743 RepID=UPI003F4212E5
MKTAIYIRVSTEEQVKEGYSISAQKQKLKAFCIAQDWDVVGIYADEGISAKDTNRPQLQQMIKDIESGEIDCVLVYRLDRLTRSVLDLYKLLEIFDQNDCKFKSATEVYDTTTAMGRMFITIVAALAQWERENMGERISFGFAEKVRQGKYALNFRPIGYNLDKETSKLSIKEDEAKIVRMIFDLYLQGYSANRLCRYLNHRNIRTKEGNTWGDKPLMQILKNPLYRGAIRWNGEVYEDTHEPIVSKEQFDEVQRTIESRRTKAPRRVSSRYIFSSKIKCIKCGYPMQGYYVKAKLASGETKLYEQYRCLKKKTGECHGARSISERKLEDAFVYYLGSFDFLEDIEEIAATSEEVVQPSEKVNIDELMKELEKIEKRKKKWQYAWSEDMMSDEDFRKRMNEADKEEKAIKEQLEELENLEPEAEYSIEQIKEVLIDIRKNWNKLDNDEKKALVDSVVDRVHFEYDEKNRLYVTGVDFY